MMDTMSDTCVYIGETLARYGFGEGHPFGPDRMDAFWHEARRQGLEQQVQVCEPVMATRQAIERFHRPEYVAQVIRQSETGQGYLDLGDTPAFKGIYEAAATVVGTVLDGIERIMQGQCRHGFVPIAGLHHAGRDHAAGFCAFNDCGVAIDTLRQVYGIQRVAYVDIDAHHGDGVFYAFDDDADLLFADMHEDGRYLYPGTGKASETGRGAARGSKLNIPMPPDADREVFMQHWPEVEDYLHAGEPEFILMQCGADSVAGDPITHLRYTPDCHGHAAARLCALAGEYCDGRLLAMGGGGYNRDNLALAWSAVVAALAAC
jgi:acetoin utilization protein AcuC